jgi:hypothetical protein
VAPDKGFGNYGTVYGAEYRVFSEESQNNVDKYRVFSIETPQNPVSMRTIY